MYNKITIEEEAFNNTPISWEPFFKNAENEIRHISKIVEKHKKIAQIYPYSVDVFNPFKLITSDKVKLVLFGEEPRMGFTKILNENKKVVQYTLDTGLSFSQRDTEELSPINKIIFNKLGITHCNGDLRGWAKQGVLLLNVNLTVIDNIKNSHSEIWDGFILKLVEYLNDINPYIVFVMLSKESSRVKSLLNQKNLIIETENPILPSSNFHQENIFERINDYLQLQCIKKIDWFNTSLDHVKSLPDSYFDFYDKNAKLLNLEKEKEKEDKKKRLNKFMSNKLLKAFNENQIENIKNSAINIACLRNWALDHGVKKIPSGLKKPELIDFIALNLPKQSIEKNYEYEIYFKNLDIINNPIINNVIDYGFDIKKKNNLDVNKYLHFFEKWIENDKPQFKFYLPQDIHCWELRILLLEEFENIWDTKKLCCSFEAPMLLKGNRTVNILTGNYKFDLGQNNCMECCNIRAFISLTENEIYIIKNSLEIFEKYVEILQKDKLYKPILHDDIFDNAEIMMISLFPGDVIYLDSRYFYSWIKKDEYRYIMPVTMMPKSGIKEIEIKKRLNIVNSGGSTNHWCYGTNFKSFSVTAWKKGKVVPNDIKKPEFYKQVELSDDIIKLI